MNVREMVIEFKKLYGHYPNTVWTGDSGSDSDYEFNNWVDNDEVVVDDGFVWFMVGDDQCQLTVCVSEDVCFLFVAMVFPYK